MIPAAILGIIFSVAGIVVPEADALVGRNLDERKCFVLTFNHDKSVAWMSPATDCRKPPHGVALATRKSQ